jgi:hypothetical protein
MDGYRKYTYEESRILIGKKVHWRATENHQGAVSEENEGVGEVCDPRPLTDHWHFTYQVANSRQQNIIHHPFDHIEVKIADEGTPISVRPNLRA